MVELTTTTRSWILSVNEWRGKSKGRPRFREGRRGLWGHPGAGDEAGPEITTKEGERKAGARGELWRGKWCGLSTQSMTVFTARSITDEL